MSLRASGLDVSSCQRQAIAGVVLAGGRSRRMGGTDKSQVPLCGRSMLEIVIDGMRPQVRTLAVNTNGNSAHLFKLNLSIVTDGAFSFAGPLAGILAGMQWARHNIPSVEWLATAATDTPFFPSTLVHGLLNASGQSTVARLAASRGRIHPVFGLWPIDLAPGLAKWLAEGASRKVRDWVDHIPHVVVDFDDVAGRDPFFNVNTPHDLTEARSLVSEAVLSERQLLASSLPRRSNLYDAGPGGACSSFG